MVISKKTIIYSITYVIYYSIVILYAFLLAPILIEKFNIFHTFMYRQMHVSGVFIVFGLLLGMNNLIPHFLRSRPYTFCTNRVFKGIRLLLIYCFICFLLIFFEILQQYEGLHIVLTAMSSYVGYHTINSFSLVKPQ